MNISILIPTKDRPDFILRILKYYLSSNFSGKILIGDSSCDKLFSINDSNIVKYKANGLTIEHYHDVNLTAGKMSFFLANKVTTSYSLMVSDDDIFLTSCISVCINFLENNADYSAVHGKSLLIGIDKGDCMAFGRLTSLEEYPLATYESEMPMDRVEDFFKGNSNLNMSVIRSKINIDAFNEVNKFTDEMETFIFGELIHASIVSARGKIGEVSDYGLIRQWHNDQLYKTIDMVKWFSHVDWCDSYRILRSTIEKEVVKFSNFKAKDIKNRTSLLLSNWVYTTISYLIVEKKQSFRSCLKTLIKPILGRLVFNVLVKFFKLFRKSMFNSVNKKVNAPHANVERYIDLISDSRDSSDFFLKNLKQK
jgi:glycosyltransferase domain-containing protein